VLLVVDTDALLPPPAGQVATQTALFDALAIDVFLPGEDQPCTGCSQQFALDEDIVNSGNASVGIPEQPSVTGYRARVRLYHTTAPGAGPSPDSTIETVVALPTVGDTGEIAITVFLGTDNVANPSGTLDAPVAPVLGTVTSGHAGTWAGATVVPCAGTPNANEVCIPGGAFWMGNAAASFAGGLGVATDIQRIVVLSPFFLDALETTVGDFRGQSTEGVGVWSGSTDGMETNDWCSYSTSTARDPLPMNCITWQAAQNYCVAQGGTLPTEAQLEYVEGGLQGSLYVWGEDDPACSDAVFGLAGYGSFFGDGDGECRAPLAFGGPLEPGRDHTGSRDVLVIGGQPLYDLAGNMGEWPVDSYEPEGEDCWPTGVLQDPVCATGTTRLERGGSWVGTPENLRAAARIPRGAGLAAPDMGVRCARPDEGP
jgi:formylglycine-generating enzyme required for sulfatase activity